MGGCLTDPKIKSTKPTLSIIKPPMKPKAQDYRSKDIKNISIKDHVLSIQPEKPKHTRITSLQFLSAYRIEQTLQNSTRMEGPKLISNYIDGSCQILRVYNGAEVDQERLDAHKKLLGIEVKEDEEGNFLIFDQVCQGGTIGETILNWEGGLERFQLKGKQMLEQIYDIIDSFHKERIWLGCLTLDSFKFQSQFSNKMRLVDFNITGTPVQSMGFAHREEQGYGADWEFFGYLVKYLTSNWIPIFIAHKMQYSSNDEQIVVDLLKGKQVNKGKLSTLKFIIAAVSITYGYAFRRDINKLMKIRKKRKAHNRKYYDEQVQKKLENRPLQEVAYRTETERVMERIESYIEHVDNSCEEPFIMYATGGQKFRKLKEVFLINGVDKKIDQLRQILSTIR